MGSELHVATRAGTRVAARDWWRRAAAILLATGAIGVVTGATLLVASLTPLFVPRTNSALVVAPAEAPPIVDSGPSTAVVPSPDDPGPAPATVQQSQPVGPVDGYSFELRIPAIGYSATVHQGVGSDVLAYGPGHYPTTPWPGRPGNVGVAAHNVYWLSFNRLKVGDRVEILTQHGLYVYDISGSTVTNPNDRSVLAPTTENRLTLTTCYPLWAGAFATQRLIFTARAIGGVT